MNFNICPRLSRPGFYAIRGTEEDTVEYLLKDGVWETFDHSRPTEDYFHDSVEHIEALTAVRAVTVDLEL